MAQVSPMESFKAEAVRTMSAPLRALGLGGGAMTPDEEANWQAMYGVNPKAQMAGAVAGGLPAVALPGAGLVRGGAALAKGIAAGAIEGVAYAPENPMMGAAIGGAIPGGFAAAGAVARAVAPMAVRAMDAISDPMISRIGPQRMPGRVAQIMDAAAPDAAPGQFYKGLMRSEEIPSELMTPAMRVALDAPDAATADYAKKMLWKEGLQGVGEQEKRSQRMYMTKLVKNEMGVTDDVALTDTVIGDVLKNEGGNIGRILKTNTDLNIPLSTLNDMAGVVDSAETGWQGSLGNVVKNIEKNIEQNGALTPQGYQNAITKLNEIGAPGRSAGAIQDAKKLRDALSGQVEGSLSQAEKQLLAEARYRYKIAKTLKQGAGVGSDMMVNAASFGRNWDKKLAQTARGRDVIGKAADTMNFLGTMEANAGTTLQRLFATPGQTAIKGAGAAGLGGGGLAGISVLHDILTGQ